MNRFQFVDDHQRHHGVKRLCQVIGLARSSYYHWKATAPDRDARGAHDADLAARIRVIHRESDGTYGVPRITAELHDTGHRVNHKRVARVMRGIGLAGLRLRRRHRTTLADPTAAKVPDLLERDFTADTPNTRYVGDITSDLTPRTANLLATSGSMLANQYFDRAKSISDRNASAAELELMPAIMHGQRAEFVRRMARAFDDLVDDLHDGVEPRPHDMAEQIALDLIIQDAEAMHTDADMLNTFDQGLPNTPYDYDFDSLYDLLFEDSDHIGYLSSKRAPAAPGELEHLFEQFCSLDERDPDRGFRR
ncbi:IS3 family transposase [Saccharothrix sp. BKS2]|uniref:IS3 family transposase n=1 Tax=Saccharothrix sp. BKS2 TaxID=3064400 RepID=UPI0039EC447B